MERKPPDPLFDTAMELIGKLQSGQSVIRHIVWGLVLSVLLDISLTIVLAFTAVHAMATQQQLQDTQHKLSVAIAEIHQAERSGCERINAERADEHSLWNDIIRLSAKNPPPGQTAAEKRATRKELAQFEKLLNRTFVRRDCAR